MANVGNLSLFGIENKISSLEKAINQNLSDVNESVNNIGAQIEETQAELQKLREDFEKMYNEQQKNQALQEASTELITIRQEIETKFGSYRIVRNTMLGILQATDAALVRKTTVSTVSEELMVSAPNYWLAPVLVALAAWIGNNKDLANRAIKEAIKRDNEHTSLVMALICRRNNRTQTCYQWLSRYFSTQNSASFDEDKMVYINAYINGIFGHDEKHICDDYISHWIDQVRNSNENFEDEQATTWQNYFNEYNVDESVRYPALNQCTGEFNGIGQYLERIDAVNQISDNFNDILNAEIDTDRLKAEVDKHLIDLVRSDDKDERELRKSENYVLEVKKCNGDKDTAKKNVDQREDEKKNNTLNIVEQLTRCISEKDNKALPSQKKMAVSFLKGYINKGFTKYIAEKKDTFPQQITINLNGWSGQTSDCSNRDALQSDYQKYLEYYKNQETTTLKAKKNPKTLQIISAVILFLGIIFTIAMPVLGIAMLISAIVVFVLSFKTKKESTACLSQLDQKYQDLNINGSRAIDDCLSQWNTARNTVESFEGSKPSDIVA